MGQDLTELVVELKGFGTEEKKGFRLLQKVPQQTGSDEGPVCQSRNQCGEDRAKSGKHQITLMKDVAMFDQMYELNLKYYKELTMYIIAGKKRLAEVRATGSGSTDAKRRRKAVKLRTPRPTTTWCRCASALKRSCTIWS